MLSARRRQRTGRVVVLLLIISVLAFGGLVGYHFLNRARYKADAALLEELKNAKLREPERAKPGDWPQWRGPNRDGVSGETGLLTEWPKDGPPVVWKAKSGDGYATFAVAAGQAYTLLQDGDNEAVVCWNADKGDELWRFKYPCKYDNHFGSGPRSTPTVDGDHVYTVGATGIMHCLTAKDGKKVWRKDLLEEFKAENLRWGVSFSPLIENNLVLTNPGGPNGNSLVALDKKTGKKVWSALDDPAGYSSPIVMTTAGIRQVLFFTGKRLVSVSPQDGKLYWEYKWETDYDANVATPIVYDDYVFISSGYGAGCALLKVSSDGKEGLKVERVYETNEMCNHFSSCVLYKEHLYGCPDPGVLKCMEFRTGKVVWEKPRVFKKGSLMVADGLLIILGEDGKLALAEATPEGYKEKASYKLFDGKCWSVPVLANGKLYVRDEEQIICLDLKKK